jgi:8-oxo-dGTP pyrophosphatase MutT (NUDIX family)
VRLSLSFLQHRVREALTTRSPLVGTGSGADPTLAAVAVILVPEPDSVLLIRRAERAGDPWSGHMGLPGGRADPEDADLLATAMRETVEEVGCALDRDRLLGVLDDVWPRSPLQRLIVVRPYVFAMPERPSFTLSGEVAETYWIPLAELQRPDVYRETIIHLGGEDRAFPAYHLEPGVVWGLTERILTPLLELL